MQRRTDFLVIGSGIAGLRAAADLAASGDVVVLTKADPDESNTGYAQGGIAAAVGDDDHPDLHAADTIAAGDGLCFEPAVRVLVEDGVRYVRELVDWGARFDREASGALALAKEAAHKVRRVLHSHDATGREIGRTLWQRVADQPKVTVERNARATSLIIRDGRCAGARFESARGTEQIEAAAVLLATGGAGQVFRDTTNPAVATGDGVTLAWYAGAQVADLEFVQFHPTALNVPGAPRFLLSEALRGEGAHLINADGERFMTRYQPAGELASRDLVSRAIVLEQRRTGQPVFLSLQHLDAAWVRERFPTIAKAVRSAGFDLATDRIPVGPAAHYIMGGVETDLWGRTTIPGLFAAGEVACTGVHGANRLASNSLLEGLVFGARAAQAMTIRSNEYRRHVHRPHRARPAQENQDVVAEKRRRGPDVDVAIGGADAGRRLVRRRGIAARILVSRARAVCREGRDGRRALAPGEHRHGGVADRARRPAPRRNPRRPRPIRLPGQR